MSSERVAMGNGRHTLAHNDEKGEYGQVLMSKQEALNIEKALVGE